VGTLRDSDRRAIGELVAALEAAADPQRAAQMRAYMKDHFEFLGVHTPQRRELSRPFLVSLRDAGPDRWLGLAEELWGMPHREYAYVAADLLRRYGRRLPPASLDDLRGLVTTSPWWDGVDPLSHVVGLVVRTHPETSAVMDRWSVDQDLWVVRVAILHQLGWKDAAEPDRIFGYCVAQAGHPDFFVRKAIGWALRDLSRRFPEQVRSFIDAHRAELSPLSVREGSKYV
jgi:3-methyladenine DNA glycosylase AlkD